MAADSAPRPSSVFRAAERSSVRLLPALGREDATDELLRRMRPLMRLE